MISMPGASKSTKGCELTVQLITGVRIVGTFNVSVITSSAIRPSDAIREHQNGFFTLTNATIHEPTGPRQVSSVMVRAESIAHIELPSKGWEGEKKDLPKPLTAAAPAVATSAAS